MDKRVLWALGLLTAALAICSASNRPAGLVVHEWGTFLSMSGSDGVTLDGMYHEEHALPAFVHSRSRDQLRLRTADVKGETPVIYFYSPTPQRASVTVGFPSGIWTQWYPQANMVGPSLATTHDPLELHGGRIRWNVELLPEKGEQRVPETAPNALWNYARQVDAAFVRVDEGGISLRERPARESERFIFYRGLGRADLPLQFSNDGGGTLSCSAASPAALRNLFVVRIEGGCGSYRYFESLEPGSRLTTVIPSMERAESLETFSKKAGDTLAAALVKSGLYEKEARAMVNTWRASYLESDGIRALYVLPRGWTDAFIPMKIEPAPAALVRVMVGRTELLTPDREKAAESAILGLSSPDSDKRRAAFDYLQSQGRYVEPILRRTLAKSGNDQTRTLSRRLLETDFVTELRSALKDAATGGETVHNPLYARARLAQLLRDVGLGAEAKAEGEATLAQLSRMTAPPIDRHDARHYLRASARAAEGTGDDAAALKWYGQFVKFASQAPKCGGCHELEGPRDMRFFRDWWAGARFGRLAGKTGQAKELIAAYGRTLETRPKDVEAALALGYLYRSVGNAPGADRMFTALERAYPAGRFAKQ